MYSKTTNNVTITVKPSYLEDQSEPAESHFVWSYHIRIENNGHENLKLVSRHWEITDSFGLVQEVDGDGVVGETPYLKPGAHYEYTSGAPLGTPSGIMVGNYQMQDDAGKFITVDIPAFSLDSPHQNSVIN